MTFCEILPPLPESSPALLPGRTTVVTLLASPENVFHLLADIENLPRWAGGFCERIFLQGGRWVALTSCGELFLALEIEEPAGDVVLHAGWQADRLHRLALTITRGDEGGAQIKFVLGPDATREHAQLYRALETEVRGLVPRLDGSALGCVG